MITRTLAATPADSVACHHHRCNLTLPILDTKDPKLKVDQIDQDRALDPDRGLALDRDSAQAHASNGHLLASALEEVLWQAARSTIELL